MKCIKLIIIFCILTLKTLCQFYKIDTLKKAQAYLNSYLHIQAYGLTSQGNIYGCGINQSYNKDGKALPIEIVRIDFNTKKVQYKILPTVFSANGAFWNFVFDREGNCYLSMHEPQRKIVKLNLKDSIQYIDLENPFTDGTTWVYSASLGRDDKLYFGGSSATYWSSYNTKVNKFEKHAPIDLQNDYVLSIAGDNDYVYAQTGQRSSVQLWSIRKKDDAKKLLCKIINTTRINLETHTDGIYASFNSDTLKGAFKLVNGEMINIASMPSPETRLAYTEVNEKNQPKINAAFDAYKNKLFYSLNEQPFQSINIKTTRIPAGIKKIFTLPGDREHFYFSGDYYGNFYQYDIKKDTAYILGVTGSNIYSVLPAAKNKVYLGGYPSGVILQWNPMQPWTTRKFMDGRLVEANDEPANPKLVNYFKSGGKHAAGFHHTEQMVFDDKGEIVGAGTVIRIGDAASIGIYNPATDSIYGIDYSPYTKLAFAGMYKWQNVIAYSTRSNTGGHPKLYFYQPSLNKMIDSIDFGFDDYGKIYVVNDILIGIVHNRVYKVNLQTKKLIDSYSFSSGSNKNSFMMADKKIIISTVNKISASFWPVITLPYNDFCELNGNIYATDGKNFFRIKKQ
ncbi:MAG: hypothetical protein ABJA79_00330 [Parafilimonas sp.]